MGFYPQRVGRSEKFWCPIHQNDYDFRHPCFDFSRQVRLDGGVFPEIPEPIVDTAIYCLGCKTWSLTCSIGRCTRPVDMSTGRTAPGPLTCPPKGL